LTINTYPSGDSGPSSALDGHAWLTFTTVDGTTYTYGTWGNDNGAQQVYGVNEDTELSFTSTAQRSAYLDADAAEEFSSYVSNMIAQGPDAWSWSWPCSGFASVGWFIGTHEYLDPTQGGLINSPTNLQNAINTANGSN